jgi:NAD(P)H-dependent FMN reductase/DNA-binding MarR family transcriptional regulator
MKHDNALDPTANRPLGAAADERVAPHPGVDIPEAPVGSLLLQVIRAHAMLGTEMLRKIGVMPPQELVLIELAKHGGARSQAELVRFLGRDRSTVTKTLQAMERTGLIARQPSDTDGRAVMVALTDKGRRLEPLARDVWTELERRTVAGLEENDRRVLMKALASVRGSLSSPELARAVTASEVASAATNGGLVAEPSDGERLRVAVIVASTREGRFGDTVARWFVEQIRERDDVDVDVVDLFDIHLPRVQQAEPLHVGQYASPAVRALAARIGAADAFVVITPEYNHGYPAGLKLAIDSIYPEWHGKPVGFVSYGGRAGGLRAVEQLRPIFAELHMVTIRETVSFHMARSQFDENARPRDPEGAAVAAATLLEQLTWWAKALRDQRAQRPYAA